MRTVQKWKLWFAENSCASLQYHSRKLIFMHGTSLTAQDMWEPNLFAIADFKPGSKCLYVPYLYGYECKWDFRAAVNIDFQQIICSEHKASAQFVWYAQQHPSSFPIIVWRREVWTLCYILPPVFHRRKKKKITYCLDLHGAEWICSFSYSYNIRPWICEFDFC